MAPVDNHIVGQFCAITGTNQDTAIRLLDSYDWNLERAINRFIDGDDGGRPNPSGSNTTYSATDDETATSSTKSSKRLVPRKEFNPLNFSNITIHTKSSKKMAKKLAGRLMFDNSTTNNDYDTSDSLAAMRRTQTEPQPRYPHVYDALLDSKFTMASLNNQKIYLPISSERKSYTDYEEITVKKMEKTQLIQEEKLISIAENFDEVGKIAFSNCKSLNPMQSFVFDTAYNTNKNMLVAAPTGSGKTNVAMLTVLNELRNWFKPNTTEMIVPNTSEKVKIIYIAPMKSLATEQTDNFESRLKKLGIKTRELTGDMSLTEREISQTHIIVTTPEKWDVVTRKSKGEVDLLSLVRLLIIDEVHLLQSDRGHVLEALVARTLRYVESSQRMTRIVGLSATLPNYVDVANFLRVNPFEGLFYFDNRFRPVPLTQTFVGVRPLDSNSQSKCMDKICYDIALHHVTQSKQVMIFVHARNSTQKTATKMREIIQLNNKLELFKPDLESFPEAAKLISNPRNKLLKDLFSIGFGIHHAGMIRQDRLLVERLFREGVLKVLVCTATLAWGVNFPAHAVVIRGTEIYDSSAGKFVDVGLLDVMQIFGRAGRPQYDIDGHATIISHVSKMDGYLKLLTNQTPIESNFIKHLTDNLNAEIVSGTVSTVQEGMEWLRYTYLNIRLSQNPLVYGFDHYEIESDRFLTTIRERLIKNASIQLDEARMIRYNQQTGQLEATDLGRIASHFYINYETVSRYNEILDDDLEPQQILSLIGEAQEFQQIKFREGESNELDKLRRKCYLPVDGGQVEQTKGKVSCLLQAYISRSYIESHSLISDLMYISQNATRIARGLFEYSLKRGWPTTTLNLLKICKMLELQTWNFHSPLRHFDIDPQIIARLEDYKCSIEQIENMTGEDLAKLVFYPDKMGHTLKDFVRQLPYVIVEGSARPIKSNLLRLDLTLKPEFKWNDRYHGKYSQNFWMWVVDEEITNQIYYSEHIKLTKEQVRTSQIQKFSIMIPMVDDTLQDGSMGQRIPNEYIVFVLSDGWTGCDYEFPIECHKVILPPDVVAFTKVPPNLNQLPLSTLNNALFEAIFTPLENKIPQSDTESIEGDSQSQRNPLSISSLRVDSFNSIQSQVFFSLYHCDRNLMICGPTGSGKTLMADLAMLRIFATKGSETRSRHKVIFITPIEQLALLKYRDWKDRVGGILGKRILMFTDHTLYDRKEFDLADVIVTSADKFYIWLSGPNSVMDIQKLGLLVLDDLQLICDRRGSSLELIVSKLNCLKQENPKIRFRYVGISNTVANAHELANWLGIKKNGAFNFHPATSRPIQLIIHISGHSERHYTPRMASMNKPIYNGLIDCKPDQTALVFVSSKRQCTSTAKDLISFCVHDNPSAAKRWLHIDHLSIDSLVSKIHDEDLKLSLEFGIGILFPSLIWSDKKTVQELFLYKKIQVLICTSNYVWETNLRAQLVIVKGTEHYDSESGRFLDYPPADVIQMLGKAGRPNEDSTGVAILMIRDIFKEFYKKFLYETFPVESNLLHLDETLLRNFVTQPSADTSTGNETDEVDNTKRNAMKMFSYTLLVRRLEKNPSYYSTSNGDSPAEFLSRYLDKSKIFEIKIS